MCGRFENVYSMEDIIPHLDKDFVEKISVERPTIRIKTINIAPSDMIVTMNKKGEQYIIDVTKWGIKFKSDSPLIFNSRIETVSEKPFWKNSFNKNRLLVPMSGFYEWKLEGKKKQPYKITLPGQDIFFVPALYAKIGDEYCASLITTEPNKFMKDVHKRMPVIFTKDLVEEFFNNTIEENLELCKPLIDSEPMEMEPADI